MSKELVIDFKNTGAVEALHMDGFDLGFLGDKTVYRQTDIVFDDEVQLWDLVYLQGGATRFYDAALQGFPSYEIARGYEVAWLNDCRLIGCDPVSDTGLAAMVELREIGEEQQGLAANTHACDRYESVFA
jgi:hypothetical protein